MKHLSTKDYVIIAMFFVLMLVMSSLFMVVDETPLEGRLPWFYGPPMLLGFYMSLLAVPISLGFANLLSLFGVPATSELHFALVPWISAILYSGVLAFALVKLNAKRAKSSKG